MDCCGVFFVVHDLDHATINEPLPEQPWVNGHQRADATKPAALVLNDEHRNP
jgi:hypothetical protein